ncbi:restriction endonuclease subunit S [Megasphaera sp. UBA4233]|uniref:restriction endonuclease subunit S n=2 Tax=unclassified Megasphaera TaxID=2626256 RepID=UPI0025C0A442|nr:restriction endonuclease subunit S [Megasphaera sp. UBA4233]
MVKYPPDWKQGELKDFAIINPKSDLPFSFTYVDLEAVKGISLINPRKETQRTAPSRARRVALKGDIFFQTVRPYQRNNYLFNLNGDYVFSTGYAQIRAKINPNFLFILLRQERFVSAVLDNCTGTSYPAINPSRLSRIQICIPSTLNEQKAIADTISTFDTYISNLTELIEKKKAIREGALEDLVSGKTRLEGFGGEWKKGRLLDFTKIKRGKRVVRSQLYTTHKKETFPVYQNSLEPLGYFNDYNCRRNSVFVIAAGNAGDIGFSNENFWAADDCYSFEHTDNVSQKFLLYLLLSRQQEISAQTRRTSIPRLSRDILENLLVMLPKQNEQQAIVNTLTAMDDEIRNLETELDKMKQIREGAMDDLLTGRIRLPL